MRVCLHCGEIIQDEKVTVCPHCSSSDLKETITEDERRTLSKSLHKKDSEMYDREQNSLCFVVLGAISLIVSALFFILSFTRKRNIRRFNPGSLQFVICVITLVLGLGLLGYGLYRLFNAMKIRSRCHRLINALPSFMEKEKSLH